MGRTIKEFCEEEKLNYERVRSILRYHKLMKKLKYEGRPGTAPQRVLNSETEDFVMKKISEMDSRKSKNNNKPINICLINQKGGVGKTTSAVSLAANLSLRGYSVCLFDCDPQGSSTMWSTGQEPEYCLIDVLKGTKKVEDVIIKSEKFDVVPATLAMDGADIQLFQELDRHSLLKEAISNINYDFIIFDGPPSLTILSTNALIASDWVLIPLEASGLSLVGIRTLFNTINKVKRKNRDLEILGTFFTRYENNKNLAKSASEYFEKKLSKYVMTSNIRKCSKLEAAPSHYQDIYSYDPTSNGAEDYKAFTSEILNKLGLENE